MSALDDTVLPFLHGTLLLKIEEAKDLPDTDRSVGYGQYRTGR